MKHIVFVVLIATIIRYINGQDEGQDKSQDLDDLNAAIDAAQKVCMQKAPISLDALPKIVSNEEEVDDSFKLYLKCMGEQLGARNEDGSFNTCFIKDNTAAMLGSRQLDDLVELCNRYVLDNPPENDDDVWWEMFNCGRLRMDAAMFLYLGESWLHLKH